MGNIVSHYCEFDHMVHKIIFFNKKFMNDTQQTKTNHNSSLLDLEFVHYSVN